MLYLKFNLLRVIYRLSLYSCVVTEEMLRPGEIHQVFGSSPSNFHHSDDSVEFVFSLPVLVALNFPSWSTFRRRVKVRFFFFILALPKNEARTPSFRSTCPLHFWHQSSCKYRHGDRGRASRNLRDQLRTEGLARFPRFSSRKDMKIVLWTLPSPCRWNILHRERARSHFRFLAVNAL